MLMDTQVRDCMPLTVRVDRAGRRVPDESCLMQIVFYGGIAAQSAVIFCDGGFVHQEIRPYTVNGNRILRDKHAGGVISVKGRLLPS